MDDIKELSVPITGSYYPLIISYNRDGRHWELRIKSRPENKITFTGDQPTVDEIVESLGATGLPTYMVSMITVLAAVHGKST